MEAKFQAHPGHPDAEPWNHMFARDLEEWSDKKYSETGKTCYAIAHGLADYYLRTTAETERDAIQGMGQGGTGSLKSVVKGITTPVVSNSKLQNIVKDLYKGVGKPGSVGIGTTADAIRSELRTGVATGGRFHSTKGAEYARALEKWLQSNPNAPSHDRLVGQSLLDDLNRALSGN